MKDLSGHNLETFKDKVDIVFVYCNILVSFALFTVFLLYAYAREQIRCTNLVFEEKSTSLSSHNSRFGKRIVVAHFLVPVTREL